MLLLTCLIFLVTNGASGIECPEYSDTEIGQQRSWICENANWWKDLDDWKRDIQSKCTISDLAEYFRIECPDYSRIRCANSSSLRARRNSFNCTIVSCLDGSYTKTDNANLREISGKSTKAYKKLMLHYRNELRDCTSNCLNSPTTTETTYTPPNMVETSTRSVHVQNTTRISPMTFTTVRSTTTAEFTTTSESMVEGKCPHGWTKTDDRCYYLSFQHNRPQINWDGARTQCETMFSTLVTIDNEVEHELVKTLTRGNVWIGANDLRAEGVWEWVDGSPFVYTNWISGQPDNSGSNEQCAEIREDHGGFWNDINCAEMASYACEKGKVYDQSINDYIGNEWKLSGNFVYKAFSDRVNYQTAKSSCESVGGNLAAEVLRHPDVIGDIIDSGLVDGAAGEVPWIGFDDIQTEGSFLWVDGGNMNVYTTAWSSGQPDNYRGNENCVHVSSVSEGKVIINDSPCDSEFSYICEINVDNL